VFPAVTVAEVAVKVGSAVRSEVVTANCKRFDEPAVGLTTDTVSIPAEAVIEAGTAAFNWVPLT
jgi:hypothetical protein